VTSEGVYTFMTVFSSKDEEKVSSFNYTAFSLKNLEKALLGCGSLDILLQQSTEQINTRPLEGKFAGDIIITPDCLSDIWILRDTGWIRRPKQHYRTGWGAQVLPPQPLRFQEDRPRQGGEQRRGIRCRPGRYPI
jgi:hypothetical protein